MTFTLDKALTDVMDSSRLTRFLDKSNAGYNTIYDLVGGTKPFSGAKMQFTTTRTLDPLYEGQSGQPIMWAARYSEYCYNGIDQAAHIQKILNSANFRHQDIGLLKK